MALGEPPVLRVGSSALQALHAESDDQEPRLALQDTIERWSDILVDGYGRGRAFRGSLILGVFRSRHRRQITRELKRTAVELMSGGAEVGGVVADPVPLVAYALLIESLPVSVEPASPEGVERINNLLLETNRAFHDLPEETAPLLADVFVLAVILGEAERYTDQLGLLGLRLGDETGPTRSRRKKYLIALAAAAGAAATLISGYTLGSSGGSGHASTARVTVTRNIGKTRTVHDAVRVVRTRTVPVTTTVVKKVVAPGASTKGHGATTTVRVVRTRTVPVTTTVVKKVVVPGPSTRAHVATTTVVRTTTLESPHAQAPPRTRTVVPASCASVVADGRRIALLAVSSFPLFAQYAKLASEAISATTARDTAKMAAITRQTNAIGQTLSSRAQQISRLGDEFEASSARCRS
jgi:hypothetical protein